MSHDEFRFEFCSAEEVDSRFESVIRRCKDAKNYEEIEKIIRTTFGNTVLQITILEPGDEFTVYRVTRKYPEFEETDPLSYSFPPQDKTPLNRANIAGHPVLYTSFNVATALRESMARIDSDEWFFISEWSVKITEETYQYSLLINSETVEDKFLTTPLVKTLLEKCHKFFEQSPDYNQLGFRRLLIKYGDLFSFPGSDFYHISSAIAHHALYEARKQGAMIPILMYPSIISGNELINYAFHPEFVNGGSMKLIKVAEYQIDEIYTDKIRGRHRRRGINSGGRIKWLKYKSELEEVFLDDVKVVIEGKIGLEGSEALNLKLPVNKGKLRDILNQIFQDAVLESGTVIRETSEVKDVFDFSSKSHEHHLVLDIVENALQVIFRNEIRYITRIVAHVKWKAEYFV